MNIPVKKLAHTRFGLPELGLGTWQMGGRWEADFSNDAQEVAAIRAAIEIGITHLDTAAAYGAGHAEELVGEATKGREREELFITSKVDEYKSHEDVVASCTKSLKRLNTPYLDLFLLHHFNPNCPLEESVKGLDIVAEQKLAKHIGVSNFTKEHLRDAQKLAKHKIVCNQVYYSLLSREPEASGLLKYCQKNDVFLVAYRPVEKGALLESMPPIMEELCTKYQKTPAQIALNWLTTQPNVVAIFKTSNAAHLKENLGAAGWHMTEADVGRLRKEYPQQRTATELPLG